MQLPGKVKVGGIVYTVHIVPIPSEYNRNLVGHIDYSTQEIKIREGMGEDYTNQVFFHELFHAMYECCGIEQDEGNIDRLAHCLYQILKDNEIFFHGKARN